MDHLFLHLAIYVTPNRKTYKASKYSQHLFVSCVFLDFFFQKMFVFFVYVSALIFLRANIDLYHFFERMLNLEGILNFCTLFIWFIYARTKRRKPRFSIKYKVLQQKTQAQFFWLIFQTIPWYSLILKCFVLSILKGEINIIHYQSCFYHLRHWYSQL